jgi:hemerythrin superfamily protein
MNAIELLTDQHTEVDQLFAKIEKTEDADQKKALFNELADKVAVHASIEEKLFYPAVMARQTEEILLESVEEHLAVKRVLADLLTLDVEDEHFDAKLSVMKEELRHHAHDEEEGTLFPKVRRLLSTDDLEGLGGELLNLFETLLTKEPRRKVPMETRAAAPLPSP